MEETDMQVSLFRAFHACGNAYVDGVIVDTYDLLEEHLNKQTVWLCVFEGTDETLMFKEQAIDLNADGYAKAVAIKGIGDKALDDQGNARFHAPFAAKRHQVSH